MRNEFEIIKRAYVDEEITEVCPVLDQKTGHITYPKMNEYLEGISKLLKNSHGQMVGIFYTGASQLGTGNWVLPNEEGISILSLEGLYRFLKSQGWKGQLWMQIDCP